MPRRVGVLEASPDAAFDLQRDHMILWQGAAVARLRPGASFARPMVETLDTEFLDGPQRERIRLRLQAWIDALIARELAPLFAAMAKAAHNAALRGPLHRLLEAGGVAIGNTDDIAPALRSALKATGVRAGRFALYVPALLKPRAAALRAQLWALRQRSQTPALPNPGMVALNLADIADPSFLHASGWVTAGASVAAGWISPSGWRPNSPIRRAASQRRCRWKSVSAWGCGRICCRRCCAAWACAYCRPRALRRRSMGRRRRR